MEAFSILGLLGFIFSMAALARVRKLEDKLKALGVLDQELKSE